MENAGPLAHECRPWHIFRLVRLGRPGAEGTFVPERAYGTAHAQELGVCATFNLKGRSYWAGNKCRFARNAGSCGRLVTVSGLSLEYYLTSSSEVLDSTERASGI
jgi:hypothetical protein